MKLLRDVVKKRTSGVFSIYRCPSCMFVTYASRGDARENALHADECELRQIPMEVVF